MGEEGTEYVWELDTRVRVNIQEDWITIVCPNGAYCPDELGPALDLVARGTKYAVITGYHPETGDESALIFFYPNLLKKDPAVLLPEMLPVVTEVTEGDQRVRTSK